MSSKDVVAMFSMSGGASRMRVLISIMSVLALMSPAVASAQRPTERVGGHAAAKGEVVVTFTTTPTADLLQFLGTVHGADRIGPLAQINKKQLWRLHSTIDDIPTLVAALSAFPEVQRVEPNYIIAATGTPTEPLLGSQ